MIHTADPRPSRKPLWVVILSLVVLGALTWWWTLEPRVPALSPGWSATVLTIAGDGVVGTRSGAAFTARFEDPFGVAVHPDGTIFVSDGLSMPRVRALYPDGRVVVVAGGNPGFEDGPAATARFSTTSGLAVAPDGTLYVADTGNNAIRRISTDGQVSTVAGDGVPGYIDGPAATARFNGPIGVALQSTGGLIVADTYNDRIRHIAPDGTVTTIGGSHTFDTPSGVAVDSAGHIYVADTGAAVIHVLDPSGGLTTLPSPYPHGLVRPIGIAIAPGGEVYVADERGRIVEIPRDRAGRIVAGSAPGFLDGTGDQARFRRPSGVAVVRPGRLVVADTGNSLIRLVSASSELEFRPPPPPGIEPQFDSEVFGLQPLLWPVPPMAGPHEIAGTMGEARGTAAERLHSGVDVRIEDGTPVLATRAGIISSPVSTGEFGTLNEWLRIGALTYVHMRAGRDRTGKVVDDRRFLATYDDLGVLAGMRVRRGARFESGDLIGSVNRFNHVHMNVGWAGEEHNPLTFRLVHFTDSIPPTIPRGGITLLDDAGTPVGGKARGRPVVSGPVQIVAEAWDQIDGNRPSRRLAPYALAYQVLRADGSPAPGFDRPQETIRMDQLGGQAAAGLIYAPGSGIPFYSGGRTRFLFNVTNTFVDGLAQAGRWNTQELEPGDYTVRVFASDAAGNSSTRDLAVAVERAVSSPPLR